MNISIKRWLSFVDQIETTDPEGPLRRVAVVAIVDNPYAGKAVQDLTPMIDASEAIGQEMAERAIELMKPFKAVSCGKGGVVGLRGEQEHINALLTTKFAVPLRAAMGGGKAWISSMTKRGGPGTVIDIPLAHKDALYVRSHYDGMTMTLHDAPLDDEIAVIAVIANRGRIGARVGGLRAADIKGEDGLT